MLVKWGGEQAGEQAGEFGRRSFITCIFLFTNVRIY